MPTWHSGSTGLEPAWSDNRSEPNRQKARTATAETTDCRESFQYIYIFSHQISKQFWWTLSVPQMGQWFWLAILQFSGLSPTWSRLKLLELTFGEIPEISGRSKTTGLFRWGAPSQQIISNDESTWINQALQVGVDSTPKSHVLLGYSMIWYSIFETQRPEEKWPNVRPRGVNGRAYAERRKAEVPEMLSDARRELQIRFYTWAKYRNTLVDWWNGSFTSFTLFYWGLWSRTGKLVNQLVLHPSQTGNSVGFQNGEPSMIILLNMIKNTTWYRPFAQSFSVRHLKPREIANALTAALPWQSKPCLFFLGKPLPRLKRGRQKKTWAMLGRRTVGFSIST